jgi:hypothetical protein
MTLAAAARAGASVLVVMVVSALALAAHRAPRVAAAGWRESLQRADAALAGGDSRAARQAWEQAYRTVMRSRESEGLLAVGDARLRVGEAAREGSTAVAPARRIFLTALVQARERGDSAGVAAASAAFAALGDRDVADRGFAVAASIATRQGDAAARARIAALQAAAANFRHSPY